MYKPTVIRTYAALETLRRMFLDRQRPLEIVLIGRPGIGKSTAFKRILTTEGMKEGTDFGYLSGNITAFDLYRNLWDLRNLPIVMDDVDYAFSDGRKKNLLKGLLEHERPKVARWGSASKILNDDGIPRAFKTTSNFAIILNKLGDKDEANLSAILSRAYLVEFAPTKAEVHNYVNGWFKDKAVLDYCGQFLDAIDTPDIRDYRKASDLKYHGQDWQGYLIERWSQDADARRRINEKLKGITV